MKKILLSALFLLTGCISTTEMFSPSKTIRNPECKDIDVIDVAQVLDNFILGEVCEEYSYYYGGDRYCKYENEHRVYLAKNKGEVYYDNQKIKVPDGKCITYVGSYTYETRSGFDKTVPKVKIVDAEIPNPEYQKWEKEQKSKK